MKPERTLSSETVFQGRIVRKLRVDRVAMPTGREVQREIVEHAPAVCIVAVDGEGRTVLERQYRLAAGETLLEIPAGGIDPEEDPLSAAKRELLEETGYTAREWKKLGGFYSAPGFCTEFLHLYLARGLTLTEAQPEEDEDIELVLTPVADIPGLIASGAIHDGKSVAGLLQALYVEGLLRA